MSNKHRLAELSVKLAEEIEEIKEDYIEFMNRSLEREIELKEEIENLKSQIPDKKGKKLSQKDKQLLYDIYPTVADLAMPGQWVEHCNLLKRLMK